MKWHKMKSQLPHVTKEKLISPLFSTTDNILILCSLHSIMNKPKQTTSKTKINHDLHVRTSINALRVIASSFDWIALSPL